MANKKITDLTLRSEVTADLSLPSDDGIQSYRVTAAQLRAYILAAGTLELASLDLDIFHGLSAVAATTDDFIIINDTSDANKVKRAQIGPLLNNAYRAVTTTDSVQTSDETMKLSGASFTSTLPTAVGVAGKRYKFVHGGTSFTQIYSIATTSGQTVGPFASGAAKLATNGEVLEVESDGANWMITNRVTTTNPVAYTPTFSASMGTVSASKFFSWRVGNELCIKGTINMGTTTSAIASFSLGFNGVNLPSGLAIDTTLAPSTPNQIVGHHGSQNTSSSGGPILTNTGTSTTLLYFGIAAAVPMSPVNAGGGGGLGGPSNIQSIWASVPIANLQG